jgi:histone deacetylase 1/2
VEAPSPLLYFGFCASSYDPSLFVAHIQGATIIIMVYVDDILITASDTTLLNTFIQHLNTRFALQDLGPLHDFLGIEVHSSSGQLHLSQTKYIRDLLSRTNMLQAKPCSTPMAATASLSIHDGDPFEDPKLYRSVVGALQYATITRPDISFAVNKVSQFMHSPTSSHWIAVKRILRFGTLTHGLTLQPTSSLTLHAYSDADWAVLMIGDLRQASAFSLAQILFPGVPRKGQPSPVLVQRLNIEAWLLRVPNSCGYNIFFKSFTFLCPCLLRFGVTI